MQLMTAALLVSGLLYSLDFRNIIGFVDVVDESSRKSSDHSRLSWTTNVSTSVNNNDNNTTTSTDTSSTNFHQFQLEEAEIDNGINSNKINGTVCFEGEMWGHDFHRFIQLANALSMVDIEGFVGLNDEWSAWYLEWFDVQDGILLNFNQSNCSSSTDTTTTTTTMLLSSEEAFVMRNFSIGMPELYRLLPKQSLRDEAVRAAETVQPFVSVHRALMDPQLADLSSFFCIGDEPLDEEQLIFFSNIVYADVETNNNETVILFTDGQISYFDRTFPLLDAHPKPVQIWMMVLSSIHYGNPMSLIDYIVAHWRIHRDTRPHICYSSTQSGSGSGSSTIKTTAAAMQEELLKTSPPILESEDKTETMTTSSDNNHLPELHHSSVHQTENLTEPEPTIFNDTNSQIEDNNSTELMEDDDSNSTSMLDSEGFTDRNVTNSSTDLNQTVIGAPSSVPSAAPTDVPNPVCIGGRFWGQNFNRMMQLANLMSLRTHPDQKVGLQGLWSHWYLSWFERRGDVLLFYRDACESYWTARGLHFLRNWTKGMPELATLIPRQDIRDEARDAVKGDYISVHRRHLDGQCLSFIRAGNVFCTSEVHLNETEFTRFCDITYDDIENTTLPVVLFTDGQVPEKDNTFPQIDNHSFEVQAWMMTLSKIHYANPMSSVDFVVSYWRKQRNIIPEGCYSPT